MLCSNKCIFADRQKDIERIIRSMLDKLKLLSRFITQSKLVLTPSRNWKGREFAEWFWNSHERHFGLLLCLRKCLNIPGRVWWSMLFSNLLWTPTFFAHHLKRFTILCIGKCENQIHKENNFSAPSFFSHSLLKQMHFRRPSKRHRKGTFAPCWTN